MAARHDILLVQKSTSLPDGLRESLQAKGFVTRVVSIEEEIGKTASKLNEPIVLVYCGEVKQDVARTVGRLSELKETHALPLVVVGHQMDRFESHLNQHFVLATTLVTPCSSQDILQAIEYIVRYYEKFKKQVTVRTAERAATTGPARGPLAKINKAYEEYPSIPDLVFRKLLDMKILERSLRGAEYATIVRIQSLSSKNYLPTKGEVRTVFEEVCTNSHRWTRNHLHRTAFLADLLFEALGFSGESREAARTAACLYSWTFAPERKDLLRKNYVEDPNSTIRFEFAAKIKESAMKIASELGLPMAGNITAALARLLGREEVPSDSTDSLLASCIMGADLVDRLSTRAGLFHPAAAYSLMNLLKSDSIRELHPLVLCCIVKILAEGITATSSVLALSKKMRKNPKLLEAAKRHMEMPIGADEIRVAITSLSPGMKLSRPVMTFDGKEILKEEMILDEDIIWRIWRLAALRPLNGPVVIFSDA